MESSLLGGWVTEAGIAAWGSGGINHVHKRCLEPSLLLFVLEEWPEHGHDLCPSGPF